MRKTISEISFSQLHATVRDSSLDLIYRDAGRRREEFIFAAFANTTVWSGDAILAVVATRHRFAETAGKIFVKQARSVAGSHRRRR